MKLFETERLWIRKLVTGDSEFLYPILSDPETMVYYPKPYTLGEVENWIERSKTSYEANGFGLWAVILKQGNRFIGQGGISLQNIDGHTVPEIGYQLNKAYWNQGLATELAKQCLKYGIQEIGLAEIFIHTWIKNIPSRRVAEKAGMVLRKEYDKVVDPSGKTMKHVVYSLAKSEYLNKR